MTTNEKVKQMSHLKQRQISDNSCKSIVIDTLFETSKSMTKAELSKEILSLFHILVSDERLDYILSSLLKDRIILVDSNNYIAIEPTNKALFLSKRQKEIEVQNTALDNWIKSLKTTIDISDELAKQLKEATPVFLRTLFVKHGVKSYELLSNIDDDYSLDIKHISRDIAKQFEKQYEDTIGDLIPTIFQNINDSNIVEYLTNGIKKAVGYISEVISSESLAYLTSNLSNLTLYLDTNVLYRMLHLQGDKRFESIMGTLTFCKQNNISLKISAETKKEFASRIDFDAKVLKKYPVKVDLARLGYKYRSSENYVSTFWAQAQCTGISVDDYIQYYKNFDILLDEAGIEVESVNIEDEALNESAKSIFEKLSQRDSKYEKNSSTLWHDSYNLAYVQKLQKVDAQNAIDSGCLFLTTDQSIIMLQREDSELKNHSVVAISPSQLLQMFGFTKPDSGYEETFIKFFASSSLGSSFDYSNDDIQEILSRISHYQGVNPTIAERILARELLNDGFLNANSDEEKEEIIYKSVSEELLSELEETKKQIEQLKDNGEKDSLELARAQKTIEENKKRFDKEIEKLNDQIADFCKEKETESCIRRKAEEEIAYQTKRNNVQEQHYVDTQMKKWRSMRLCLFWIGVLSSVGVIIASIVFCIKKDSGYLGILGALAVTVPLTGFGASAFSASSRSKHAQAIKEEYNKTISKKI